MEQFGTTVPCLDKRGQPDIDCSCRRFRNCMDANFNKVVTGLNIKRGKTKSLRKKVAELSNGVVGQGGNLGQGVLANNAIKNIKRDLAKIDRKVPVKGLRLNQSQTDRARNLVDMGIPKGPQLNFQIQDLADKTFTRDLIHLPTYLHQMRMNMTNQGTIKA